MYWRCRKLLFYCSYSKPTLKDTMWCVIDSSDHSWLVSCESMWEVGTATLQWEWSFLAADWVRAMAISVKIKARFVGVIGINTASDISKLFYSISRVDRRRNFEAILIYHGWYLCQVTSMNSANISSLQIHGNFEILTTDNLKLSWNATAVSQSDSSNFYF